MRFVQLTMIVTLTLSSMVAVAETNSVARIDNAAQIDEIVLYYQAQCDEEQASVLPEIDEDDADKPEKGILTLAPDSIHDIQKRPRARMRQSLSQSSIVQASAMPVHFFTHLAQRLSRNSCSKLQLAQKARY